jgi:hypothetical protein
MTKKKETKGIPDLFARVPPANLGLVTNPFNSRGQHRLCMTILSFFLDTKPKKKLDILIDGGILKDPEGINIGSYATKYFASLSHTRAIRYDSLTQTWERGANFNAYLAYTLTCMLATPSKEKVHNLLTKSQVKRIETDFDAVVLEMLEDKATIKTLKRIWRNTESAVQDFILNSDDD